MQAYLETRSALIRMIDPAAMGRFRVMAFGRGLEAGTSLPGLA
jgi:SAM-dependent MidA family methyltransferase